MLEYPKLKKVTRPLISSFSLICKPIENLNWTLLPNLLVVELLVFILKQPSPLVNPAVQ